MSPASPIHAKISGPIVMIGFGSIGKGTLPLIERHFSYDKSRFVVIDPSDRDHALLNQHGVRFIHEAVTRENYRELLTPLLTKGGGQGRLPGPRTVRRRTPAALGSAGLASRDLRHPSLRSRATRLGTC